MNLFINSPAYFTAEYGVIDEIYKMTYYFMENINVAKYTDVLDTIGIVPIIAPSHILMDSAWKERKYISIPYRMADISLRADFESYYNGNIDKKREIMFENILDCMKVIKRRLKGKFDYQQLEEDLTLLYRKLIEENELG